ncbi:hypothetical protein K461DRAFT_265322 [Myriangium duriaei CBS 260.36]|uniref:C3H1-type domain-containing protein n=1 Tax=Myriangium duriaei CBS 260.36 TaxID=1168546 RepID=A0A9P4MK24_9PEZI|nr:hypothetical protein K461DRAFT_265322 [Myriangium duriaei CBS 260.36]
MDHSHNSHAVQQSSANGLDGFQGFANHQFDNFFADQTTDNGFDHSWAFAQSDATVAPTSQSVPAFNHWQSQNIQSQSLDPYARQFSKSPAAQAASPSPYSGYSNVHHGQNISAFDTAMNTQNGQHFYPNPTSYSQQQSTFTTAPNSTPTVAPNAVESTAQSRGTAPQKVYLSQPPVDQKALLSSIPASQATGIFNIVDAEKLSGSTASKRMALFVNVGQQDFEYPINKAVVPAAPIRRSRKDLRKLAANDPKLLAKLGKKSERKALGLPKISKESKPKTMATSLQTAKGVQTEAGSSSEGSSSESDSSDYDSDDEPELPNPLPAKRPEESPKEAVRYDSLKALWRSRRSRLPLSEIRAGLKDFWEVVRTIRDRWKADAAAVKAAEEKGRSGELPLLKSRVRDQREMIEVAFSAAVEHGHRSILEASSENVSFLFLCYQFLQDRYVQDDVNGVLSRAILEIVAMCITLSEEKLTKTHLVKVLPRYAKKGNTEIQTLVKKIETAAKEGTKKEAEEGKTNKVEPDVKLGSPKAASSPPAKSSSASVAGVAGVKRPAPSTINQPAKRVASGTPGTSDATPGATKGATGGVKRTATAAAGAKPANTAPATTIKSKTAVTKPSSFFNAMQSTVKKPTPAAKPAASSVVAAAIKSVEKKPAVLQASNPAGKSSFSFADTMANLDKPKDKAPTPKPQQDKPTETPEQRKKRLRKEARRGLRVTFKPESVLVEVRYFTHDPDEELGHDSSMIRDAGDLMGEGRMFKQHKDQMDMDEDEDATGEEELRPYNTPGLVNFDDVDSEEQARNFAPYGGGAMQPESPEKSARELYEANTLMVFYTDPRDIPSTPKEPVEEANTLEGSTTKDFGPPQAITMDRITKANPAPQTVVQSQPKSGTSPDIAALLAALNPQSQPIQNAPAAPAPQPQPAGGLDTLQSILAQIGQPQSATNTAPYQQPPQPTATPNMADLFASLQAPQQQQYQPQAHPSSGSDQSTANFAALFASLQQNAGAAPSIPNPAMFPAGFPAMPFGLTPPNPQQTPRQQQQQSQQSYPFENDERRRWREEGQSAQSGQSDNWNKNQNKSGKNFSDKRFTQPCKYWPMGKCQKGDKCTYLHI